MSSDAEIARSPHEGRVYDEFKDYVCAKGLKKLCTV